MALVDTCFSIEETTLIKECIEIGEYFKIGEIVALFTMVFSLIIIYSICWKRRKFRGIVLAYFFLLLSTIFAILRECSFFDKYISSTEYIFWDLMRQIEHVSLLISSFIFLYIVIIAHRNVGGG
jgi:hypothetical protein